MSRVCQDGDHSQDVTQATTRVRREVHDDDDLHGPVYDDTGGDDNDPEGQAYDDEGGEVVPHPDAIQAGYMWNMMTRHSVWPGGEGGVTKRAARRFSSWLLNPPSTSHVVYAGFIWPAELPVTTAHS